MEFNMEPESSNSDTFLEDTLVAYSKFSVGLIQLIQRQVAASEKPLAELSKVCRRAYPDIYQRASPSANKDRVLVKRQY